MMAREQDLPKPLRVFLSYAREDIDRAVALYRRLEQEGFRPWVDKLDLLPGEHWPNKIKRAIRESDAVLVLLSQHSTSKRGFVQKEIQLAIETWEKTPEGEIFLIPALLEPTEIPERLRDIHAAHLNEERGFERLTKALLRQSPVKGRRGSKARGVGAFPLDGRTRIVYTCRSQFEGSTFQCPSRKNEPTDSSTIEVHTPVDEFETLGLCIEAYNHSLFGNHISSASETCFCSREALRLVTDHHQSTERHRRSRAYNNLLQDNIIIIGENQFSDKVIENMEPKPPWQYEKKRIQPLEPPHFMVNLFSNVKEKSLLVNTANQAAALLTYAKSPFDEERKMVMLTGCHKPGQYLLLAFLHSRQFEQITQEIESRAPEQGFPLCQIVLIGKPEETVSDGSIPRAWEIDPVADDESGFLFFTADSPGSQT